MWEESVNVSAQAKGSWAMTEKPQGSVLTQHLCCYSGSHGASSRGSSWTERWTQMLRQEAGGHRRRKRWVSCSEASALYIGSCRNALRRLKCEKKKKHLFWLIILKTNFDIYNSKRNELLRSTKQETCVFLGSCCLTKNNSNNTFPPGLGGQWARIPT